MAQSKTWILYTGKVCGLERYPETFKFERVGAKLNNLPVTVLVYSADTCLSVGTSLLPGLNNLQMAMSRMMAVYTLYSAEDSKASYCRERSRGNDMKNNLVLTLCTTSGFSIISTRSTRVLIVISG